MNATINSIAPNLPANDVLKAVEWYEQKLGFSRLFIHPEESPTVGAVARDGAEIQLFQMKIDPKKSDWMCNLRVTGIEQLYEEYSNQEVIHPNGSLQVKPWGQKEFAVIDLDGACLTFSEPVSKRF
jgi:uncharacterized glyoxalase superfamily protein PhnB